MKLRMWVGNLDGSRAGLVIASSKKRAREIVGTSRTDFEDYWTECEVIEGLTPEVLYTRPNRAYPDEPWQVGLPTHSPTSTSGICAT